MERRSCLGILNDDWFSFTEAEGGAPRRHTPEVRKSSVGRAGRFSRCTNEHIPSPPAETIGYVVPPVARNQPNKRRGRAIRPPRVPIRSSRETRAWFASADACPGAD